ncbi:MAG TPA: methyl-accepting chemotaxis protein [Thioploca sp.]|nr:methyl-accepting chemotaxis protein [Thioploca sp.]
MKINTKLSLAFLIIALIFIVAGTIFIINSHNALENATFSQLESTRTDKKIQIEEFFAERKHDIHILLDTIDIFRINAFQRLQSIQKTRKLQIEKYFQKHLHNISFLSHTLSISPTINKLDETHVHKKPHIDSKTHEEIKQEIEDEFKTEISRFKTEYGYHKIIVTAMDRHVIYSTSKYDKNLLNDELKNSILTKFSHDGFKEIVIQDISLDGETPILSFISPIIRMSDNKTVGLLVASVTFDVINTIMQKKIGTTGEAYLVGNINNQTSYRSERLIKGEENNIGTEKIGEDISRAFAGKSEVKIKIDSIGEVVITSYTPLKISDLDWIIVVNTSLEEYFGISRSGENKNFLSQYATEYNYQDLLLIHPQGKIFYSTAHKTDYKTNIINGKYADSSLGKLIREVLKTETFGITDYIPYIPSAGEPSAFIAQPLIVDGNIEMILAIELNDIVLNEIVQQKAGLGESGEAYLVGSDKLMRSNSYHDSKNFSIKASFANPSVNKIENEAVNLALSGKTGIAIIPEYHDTNTLVLTAYTPIAISDKITWALLTEIDKNEAFTAVNELEWLLVITALIALLAIITIAWLVTNNIKRPLNHLIEVSNAISVGNLDSEIKVTGKDEISQLLQAFANMQTQLREHLQRDISKVIEAISQGNLEERINLQNKTGFFKSFSQSINQIIILNQTILEDIIQLLSALAHGNLKQTINNDYNGTFGRLKQDANSTVERLTNIMQHISHSSQVVANAADEISQGNLSLSQRTEQQAASLEQTSASMQQMTSTIQQSADNASQASQLAVSAKTCAEKGGEIVGITINAMAEINTSSKKITDIIEVINEIAFQTNLLALNAAVEAARAGEQGRGFAVVAAEVRTLAQRSASAAKEIKELIQDSVTKAEEGTHLANKSGETLEEIVLAVKKVSDIITEIAAATQEQSSGINQVNKAILQMDEMVQQNASLVEEAAAASEAMKEQAQNLKRQVDFFDIGDTNLQESHKPIDNKHITNKPIYNSHDDGWENF